MLGGLFHTISYERQIMTLFHILMGCISCEAFYFFWSIECSSKNTQSESANQTESRLRTAKGNSIAVSLPFLSF